MKTSQPQTIYLRPHHLLCTFCFEGKGYASAFIANYQNIANQLLNHPETQIKIVDQTDVVCGPCPHKRGTRCETQAKITQLDSRHAKMLGLHVGQIIKWNEAVVKIKSQVSLDAFQHACEGCEWKASGICQSKIFNKK